MPRYKCTIEYDGTNYFGWQRQQNMPTIQQAIEEAIYKFCGEKGDIYASGRTDAGVHATGQVIHFDLSRTYDPYRVMSAINFHLSSSPIAIIDAAQVDDEFHARFNATKRHYIYRIKNRRPPLTIDLNRAWQVPLPLDEKLMQQAASYLIGLHDFTSFRDSECQAKSPVKTIDEIRLERTGDEIKLYICAPSFLHHMVRNITGTLKMVGSGKWQPEYMQEILDAKNRSAAGPTAPACGLALVKVEY